MKTKEQIKKKQLSMQGKWGKLSIKHAESKESKIKNHVTKEEHITGEKTSYVEGWIYALEWVLE